MSKISDSDITLPAEFHTNAFDLGITPQQAVRNAAATALSFFFTLASLDNVASMLEKPGFQDHRYVRMSAERKGGQNRYEISLQILKGEFSAGNVCAGLKLPGTVTARQAIQELKAFETTCARAGGQKKAYAYFGRHYTSAGSGAAACLKNG